MLYLTKSVPVKSTQVFNCYVLTGRIMLLQQCYCYNNSVLKLSNNLTNTEYCKTIYHEVLIVYKHAYNDYNIKRAQSCIVSHNFSSGTDQDAKMKFFFEFSINHHGFFRLKIFFKSYFEFIS